MNEEVNSSNIKDLPHVTQQVEYENIQEGVDLEYVVTGSKIKENVVLSNYIENYSITFEYKVKDLVLIHDENGVTFVDDNNDVVFVLSDLVMYDSNLSVSENIECIITETGNKEYTLEVVPDDYWLYNASYPVIIDPTIEYSGDTNDINDKHANATSSVSNSTVGIIGKDSLETYKSYIEILLNDFPQDSNINYAFLSVTGEGNQGNGCVYDSHCTLEAREVASNVTFSNIINNSPSLSSNQVIDYYTVGQYDPDGSTVTWDITKNVQTWLKNGDSSRIIELSMPETDNRFMFETEEFNDSVGPVLEIGYTEIIGLKDYWTYNEQPTSLAGTGYVSDYTGNLSYVRNDVSFSTEKQTLSLTMLFSKFNNEDLGYGYGWRTNYNMEIGATSYPDLPYYSIDGSGNKVYYAYSSCDSRYQSDDYIHYTCYLSEDGSRNMLIEKENANETVLYDMFIVTLDQIVYHFGTDNYLEQIEDTKTNLLIDISYDSTAKDKVTKIEDSSGNYIDLSYSLGRLDYVYLYVKTGTSVFDRLEKVDYVYTSDGQYDLASVKYYGDYLDNDLFLVSDDASYLYDSNHNLIQSYSSLGPKTVYTYDSADRVDTINTYTDSSILGYVDYDYYFQHTKITNHKDDYVHYWFDNYGHTIQVMDSNQYVQTFKYINIFTPSDYYAEYINVNGTKNYRQNNMLVYQSDREKVTFDQSYNSSFESGTTGWTLGTGVERTSELAYLDGVYEDILGAYGIRITGDAYQSRTASFDMTSIVESMDSNAMTVGVWSFSKGTPLTITSNSNLTGGFESVMPNRSYALVMEYTFDPVGNDNPSDYVSSYDFISFNPFSDGWQYISKDFPIYDSSTGIVSYEVYLVYQGLGEVYFDGFSVKDGLTGSYQTISHGGNVIETTNSDGSKVTFQYQTDDSGTVTEKPQDNDVVQASSSTTSYDGPLNTDFMKKFVSVNNVKATPIYNVYGEVTEIKYGDDSTNFTTSTAYSSSDFYQYSSYTTDEFQNRTYYDYDLVTGLLSTITDANGNDFDYEYTFKGLLYKVKNNGYCDGSDCSTVEYSYDSDNMLYKITLASGYYYQIFYDSQNRMSSITVNNTNGGTYSNNLMSYSYYSDNGYYTNRIQNQTYGNGDYLYFEYDTEFEKVEAILHKDSSNSLVYKYEYNYDSEDRLNTVRKLDSNGTTQLSIEQYYYDDLNRLDYLLKDGEEINYIYDDFGNMTGLEFDSFEENSTHIVNYDYYYSKLLVIDILNENNFSECVIDSNGNITQGDQIIDFSNDVYTITTSSNEHDSVFGGLIAVEPGDDYRITVDFTSLESLTRISIIQYSNAFPSSSTYVGTISSNYTTNSSSYSYDFTTNSEASYIYVSINSYGTSSRDIKFSGIVLDKLGYSEVDLYDETSYTTIDNQTVNKNYYYENNALSKLNYVNLANGAFTLQENFNYVSTTTRLDNITYTLTDSNSNTSTIKYGYLYDDNGNITRMYENHNGATVYKFDYEYDEMNQLYEESIKNYNHSIDYCDTIHDDCYSRFYHYDLRGNITEVSTYLYGETETTLATPPTLTRTNNAAIDTYVHVYGDTEIEVGDPIPSLTFSYYYYDSNGDEQPVTMSMTTTLQNSVDTSTPGYKILEYNGVAFKPFLHDVDFEVLLTVGDGPYVSPQVERTYTYSTQWLDQLTKVEETSNSITTTIYEATYDNQGNPTRIDNFYYEGTSYDHAVLDYFGRELEEINIYSSNSTLYKTISFEYNDQGYRTSKTVGTAQIDYLLEGDKVLKESSDNYDIIYTYDYNGKIISYYYDDTKDSVTNGEEVFYIRNQQGDITKLINSDGIVLVEYAYDAWGNILTIDINSSHTSEANNAHEYNRYFYRGYRYDQETNLYYLNSRYYNPTIGRFINADGLLGEQGNILGHNMYAYTQNNPVMYTDSTGYWAVIDDLIALGTGFVVGAGGQLLSDLITSAMTGEFNLSSWETYIGAGIGGAAGAWVLLHTGNPVAAGATAGFLTTFVGMGLESITGKSDASIYEIFGHSLVDAGVGALLGGIAGNVQGIKPGSKIPKISGGRGNWNAVWRSALNGGTWKSNKVLIRGAISLAVDGLAMDMYYGVKQRTILIFD